MWLCKSTHKCIKGFEPFKSSNRKRKLLTEVTEIQLHQDI